MRLPGGSRLDFTHHLRMRLIWSVVVGVLMFVVTYMQAWLQHGRTGMGLRSDHWYEKQRLGELQGAVERYRTERGSLPSALNAELRNEKERKFSHVDDRGQLIDRWKRPYQYSVSGETFEIWTLGEDGKVGGYGPDSDLSSDGRVRDRDLPTLRQFVFRMRTARVLQSANIAAAFAAFLCFWTSAVREETELGQRINLVLTIVVTVILSWLVGWFHVLTGLSGH